MPQAVIKALRRVCGNLRGGIRSQSMQRFDLVPREETIMSTLLSMGLLLPAQAGGAGGTGTAIGGLWSDAARALWILLAVLLCCVLVAFIRAGRSRR